MCWKSARSRLLCFNCSRCFCVFCARFVLVSDNSLIVRHIGAVPIPTSIEVAFSTQQQQDVLIVSLVKPQREAELSCKCESRIRLRWLRCDSILCTYHKMYSDKMQKFLWRKSACYVTAEPPLAHPSHWAAGNMPANYVNQLKSQIRW